MYLRVRITTMLPLIPHAVLMEVQVHLPVMIFINIAVGLEQVVRNHLHHQTAHINWQLLLQNINCVVSIEKELPAMKLFISINLTSLG